LALLALALTLGSTLAACRRETGRSAADQRYVVRGEIVRLPQAGEGAPEIWLRHEAIPDFRSETGEKVGMDPMTMPFGLAPGLSLAGFSAGDKVRFTLEIRWGDDQEPVAVTRLEKLPRDTALALAASDS